MHFKNICSSGRIAYDPCGHIS